MIIRPTSTTAWPYRWADLPWLLGTAALYALLTRIVLGFYSLNGLVTVFWPGAGLALAALLLGGRKFWIAIYAGAFAGQLLVGKAAVVAAPIALGSVLEPLLGAWLLARGGAFDLSLSSSRDFFRLCYLAGAASPAVCAMIGVGTLLYFGQLDAAFGWRELAHWWMGDTLGIVLVAPLILAWRQRPRQEWNGAETVALFALALLAGQIIFLDWFGDIFGFINRGYWMYFIISWAAVRLGLHGVILLVAAVTLQALVGAAHGVGFFGDDLARTQLTNFWAYMMILATVGMSLAIAFAERARITAQLGASEQRYASLFEHMLDGVAHCRMIYRDGAPADYEYIAVNPAFEPVTGLKNVVGRRIGDIVPGYARDNQISLDMFGRVARTGEAARWEHYFGALDRWYAFAAYRPAADEFIAIIENITERKRAEEELRKLSLAVMQSPVSIVITDLAGCIQYVNPAFSSASGYGAIEVLGRNPRILKSGRTPPQTYAELWAALRAGKAWRGEFINRRKDGTEYREAATVSPLRRADGLITHYVGVKQDVTELRQALVAAQTSEDRLRLALEAAGLGMFDHDLVGGAHAWDQRIRALWGFGPDEPISYEMFLEGVHPDDRAATQAAVDRALDPPGGGIYHAEYRVVSRDDGSVRHVAANGRVFFAAGRPVRFAGMVKDVSAQKQLEEEVRAWRNEMEHLVRQQVAAQTASAIAHELNQPLVSISAYSEAALGMLGRGVKSPDKLKRALEGAMTQAQRAGRTLHELLDFLHEGQTVAAPVDLAVVVREALAIAADGGYGSFTTTLDLEPDLPPVLVNRVQVQKVLVNLLLNAVEATRECGMAPTAIAITLRAVPAKNMAQVTVHDNGPGFSAATARKIFEPFFTTKPKGIGLGLAISRALIEAHGGKLWADTEPGGGATFHFTVPFAA